MHKENIVIYMKKWQDWTLWYVETSGETAVIAQKLLVILVIFYAITDYILYPQGVLANSAVAIMGC